MEKKILITAAALALALFVLPQGKDIVLTADAASNTASSSTSNSSSTSKLSSVSGYTASSNNTVASSEEASPNQVFEDIATEVENAEDGAVITITRDMNINALPNNIMQTLYQKKTVTLVMEYTYNGVNYTATIAAGKAINSDIAWYGPLYLQAYYGNGVTVAMTGAGTYTIKSGDTLSKIAKANGMKLSTLQQLNAEIAAQKYIYPGQVLKLK